MFTIKICGVTRPSDAAAAAEAGADAIGLNFFAGSPRYVRRDAAERIGAALPPGVAKVGVLVNADLEEVVELQQALGLDYLQVHGEETPQWLSSLQARLPHVSLIRSLRWQPAAGWQTVCRFMEDCQRCGTSLAALLIDAFQPGQYGGTGMTLPWDQLATRPPELRGTPLVLAGGLTQENVAHAIRLARPDAVDTASGVETAPGQKCPEKMRTFVAAARAALDRE